MKPKRKETRNQKGMILISYMFISVLATLSLAFFLRSFVFYQASERVQYRISAFNLAETGIDQALIQLTSNPSYTGSGPSCTVLGNGCYHIEVRSSVTHPSEITDPNIRKIIASGHTAGQTPFNNPASYAHEMRQIETYVDVTPEPLFNYTIFGDTKVDFTSSGSLSQFLGTASCDSNLGNCGVPWSDVEKADGDMGTNGTAAASIHLKGAVAIPGDLVVGPTGDPASAIRLEAYGGSSPVHVGGAYANPGQPKVMNDVQIPTGLTNQGNLDVSSGTTTFSGGQYWFSSVDISGTGKVEFTGPATIYVSGNVNLRSLEGLVAHQNKAPNLTIHVQGSQTINVGKIGRVYGAVYAPKSTIHLQDGGSAQETFWIGSLVANQVVRAADSATDNDLYLIHDKALNSIATPNVRPKVKAWQEV